MTASRKPFQIFGSLRLTQSQSSSDSVAIVVYTAQREQTNILFVARENSAGKIVGFDPINSPEAYDCVSGPSSGKQHFLLEDTDRSIGDYMVMAYFFGEKVYFFDKSVLTRSDSQEFRTLLDRSETYAAYSFRSHLYGSYSRRVNDIIRLSGDLRSPWAIAEMTFEQHKAGYWKIIERGSKLDNSSLEFSIGGNADPELLMNWLKRFPFGYLRDVKSWVHVWVLVSDFGYQQEVLSAMGLDFLRDIGPFEMESLLVASRLRGVLRKSESEGLILTYAEAISECSEQLLGMTSAELDSCLRLLQVFTFELLNVKRRSSFSNLGTQLILRYWSEEESEDGSLAQSVAVQWVRAMVDFYDQVNSTWPSRSGLVLATIHFGLGAADIEVISQSDRSKLRKWAFDRITQS